MITEKEIEKYLFDRVRKLGGTCLKMESIPNFDGIPDRLILLPGGLSAFVEIKRQTGVLSKIQKYRISQLKKLNVNVYVVYSKENIDYMLKEINGYVTPISD